MNQCFKCGKPTHNPKFCSKSCSAQYTNSTHPRRKLTNKCATCGRLIRSSRTYCGKDCFPKKERKPIVGYERIKDFRRRIKQRAIDYKGGKCQVCGYSKCVSALEFHHKNSDEKDFAISSKTRAWKFVQIELDKCVLVCCRCHREIHAGLVDADGFAPSCY
jgi:hypothetical protein